MIVSVGYHIIFNDSIVNNCIICHFIMLARNQCLLHERLKVKFYSPTFMDLWAAYLPIIHFRLNGTFSVPKRDTEEHRQNVTFSKVQLLDSHVFNRAAVWSFRV